MFKKDMKFADTSMELEKFMLSEVRIHLYMDISV